MNMKVENEMALPTTKSVTVMLLEPYAGKLARTVLRGESSHKGADLLDYICNIFGIQSDQWRVNRMHQFFSYAIYFFLSKISYFKKKKLHEIIVYFLFFVCCRFTPPE